MVMIMLWARLSCRPNSPSFHQNITIIEISRVDISVLSECWQGFEGAFDGAAIAASFGHDVNTGLRNKSIDAEGMIVAHNLIKISVGGQGLSNS